jgi:hypothetical protein
VAIDHAAEHVAQIGVGLDAVELAGLDEARHGRPTRATAIGAGEEVVLAAERDGPDRALDRVGVEVDATVIQEAAERIPARERVADRLVPGISSE